MLRASILARTTHPPTPVTPPPATSSPSTPATTQPAGPVFQLPTLRDSVAMRMRPSLPAAAQVIVDPAGKGHYRTLAECFADVENLRSVPMAIAGKDTPDVYTRVDIGLAKTDQKYTLSGSGDIPQFVALYALDGERGSTVIDWGTEPSGNVHLEGLRIVNEDNNGAFDPKYAIHLHANGTTTITRFILENRAPKAGGYPTPIGMDGTQGGALFMHDGDMVTGSYTNLHGWPLGGNGLWQAGKPGMTVVFSQVNFAKGALFYNAQNDTTADDFWAVNCTAGEWGVWGANATCHIGGSTFTRDGDETRQGHKPVTSGTAVTGATDQRTDWPIPIGGYSAADRALYKITT